MFFKELIKKGIFYSQHINKEIKVPFSVKVSQKTKLEGANVVGEDANIAYSNIGFGTYIGTNTSLPFSSIGRFCSIALNIELIIGTHPTDRFVSTHPSFFSTSKVSGFSFVNEQKFKEISWIDDKKQILLKIGHDVWIGAGAKFMQGLTIGDGAIIAAGAVITKDVEPYSIVGGIPGKIIRYRFDPEDIDFLKSIKWWDLPIHKIKEYAPLFENISDLKAKFK